MTITVPSNYQPHVDTATVLVEQLKAVGINATILPVEWESWVDETYTGRQFQSTVVGVDASNMTARALLERFTSTYGSNFINYNNADYDQLFAQAIATYDDAAQTELYKQMERNLTENAANVYIQDLADLVAVRSGLEGVTFYPHLRTGPVQYPDILPDMNGGMHDAAALKGRRRHEIRGKAHRHAAGDHGHRLSFGVCGL